MKMSSYLNSTYVLIAQNSLVPTSFLADPLVQWGLPFRDLSWTNYH